MSDIYIFFFFQNLTTKITSGPLNPEQARALLNVQLKTSSKVLLRLKACWVKLLEQSVPAADGRKR